MLGSLVDILNGCIIEGTVSIVTIFVECTLIGSAEIGITVGIAVSVGKIAVGFARYTIASTDGYIG